MIRSCPQCMLLLEKGEWPFGEVWSCRSCGGHWLGSADVRTALAQAKDAVRGLDSLYSTAAAVGMFAGLPLPCPVCTFKLLVDTPFPGDTDLPAPVCPQCAGVWLRAGEAERLASFDQAAPPAKSDPPPIIEAETPATPAEQMAESSTAKYVPNPKLPKWQQALDQLMAGNARWAEGRCENPHSDAMRRADTAGGQAPFAAVVGCSDSRVPPELLFDTGVGDIFVVRQAGNAVGNYALDSLEYAVQMLNLPLILVLAHEECGAVVTAIEGNGRSEYLKKIGASLAPAIEWALTQPGDLIPTAVRAQADLLASKLERFLDEWVTSEKVHVVPAYYHLKSGRVELVERNPELANAPIPDTDRPAEQFPVAAEAHERWCPQCRRGYDKNVLSCPDCAAGLTVGTYRVACIACRTKNPIGLARCTRCGADLHMLMAVGESLR